MKGTTELISRNHGVRHRCHARPLWSGFRDGLFVLDGLVEYCEDQAVARGTPFCLRLVPPPQFEDFLFGRLRNLIALGHPLTVEVNEDHTGRRARLSARGWTRVLQVEECSGWPSRETDTKRRDHGH